ncbi:MAG: HNH endonuclease [Actinomycetia bacterium]|nr:HNH endonuclease [Actinomycetes bacterium]
MCGKHYQRWAKHGDPTTVYQAIPAAERFWDKVHKTQDCWLWTAGTSHGYGHFGVTRCKSVYAHRWAYEQAVGPIPEGLQIDHRCHNTLCVNPQHLRLATYKQNMENRTGPQANNTSGFWGVIRDNRAGYWRAVVQHHCKRYNLGRFTNPEEAAEVARKSRIELFTHNDVDRKAS